MRPKIAISIVKMLCGAKIFEGYSRNKIMGFSQSRTDDESNLNYHHKQSCRFNVKLH